MSHSGRRWCAAWWLVLLGPAAATAQAVEASGVLNAVWGDPITRPSTPRLVWTLTDPASEVARTVELTPTQIESQGGVRALNGRLVQVSGVLIGAPRDDDQPSPIRAGSLRRPGGAAMQATTPPQLGSKPVAVIMCKFSDIGSEPASVGTMQQLVSNSYPNLDHYYRELSAGQMDLAGSNAFGWFVLPNPRSHYVSGSANLTLLAQDCTAAADAAVDFSGFWGIALQFNADLDGFAWGGSRFLTLDGVSTSWPMIWMPLWATQSSKHGAYAHELGHALGWSHSSGPYGNTYDSEWDVMSDSYLFHYSGTGTSLPGHTIISNKDAASWIPADRRITLGAGQQVSFTLEQAELPQPGSNPLLAWLPIPGSTQRYSLEARRLIGYDEHLPGEAVIIHRVTSGNVATVVDPDNNGNPNDAGAMWLSGETFNSPEGISVAIGNRTAQGWEVTVTMPGTVTMRQLNITATGDGSGTVVSNPAGINCTISAGSTSGSCSAEFVDGATVTLIPAATTGTFDGWSGACSGGGNCSVLMDRNRTVTARFHLENRQLTVNLAGTGSGSVVTSPSAIDCRLDAGTVSGTCSAQFGLGESVVLFHATTAGTFGGWTGACTGMAPCHLDLSDHRTVGASFNLPSHQLTVAGGGNGSGMVTSSPAGISCTVIAGDRSGACSAGFTAGTVVVLTASATEGSFAGWDGACSGSGTCQVTMSAARSATATFELSSHQLTVSGGGTGSGSVVSIPAGIDCTIAAGNQTGNCASGFTEGTVVTLTATATAGNFTGWTGACGGSGTCQLTMSAARSATATFDLSSHQLTVSGGGTGSGSVVSTPAGIDCNIVAGVTSGACSAGFLDGTTVSLTATPGAGEFAGWDGACSGVAVCQVVMTQQRTVTAGFELRVHLLSVSGTGTGSGTVTSTPSGVGCSVAAGSVAGSCSVEFTEGTLVELSATATSGIFVGWTTGCTGSGNCQVSMSGARSVVANFAAGQEVIDLLVQALMAGTSVPAQLRLPIDQAGNGNGVVDIGDLTALVDKTPGAVMPGAAFRLPGGGGTRQ